MPTASGVSCVSWGGVASCVVGGFFYLIAWAKGREARQLEKVLVIERLADLKHLADLFPLLVAVTGRAFTDKPLDCELSSVPAVIAQITEEQHSLKQVVTGDWLKDVATVRSSIRECPWAVEDARGSVRLPVVEGRNASGDLALTVSGDVFKEDERPLARRAVDHLLGWKVLGMRRVERVLPVGAVVTAVGEAVQSPTGSPGSSSWSGTLRAGKEGGQVVLRAPRGGRGGPFIISRKPLPQIIEGLDDVSRKCRYVALAFGALGATLVTVKAIRGALAWMRQRRIRRRVEEAAKARAAAAAARGEALSTSEEGRTAGNAAASAADSGSGDHERGPDLCAVCLERECEAVFAQCGHMCACYDCARKLNRCPICRAKTQAIRVYRP